MDLRGTERAHHNPYVPNRALPSREKVEAAKVPSSFAKDFLA